MSALFSRSSCAAWRFPTHHGGAMCQYSAVDGAANDWHFTISTSGAVGAADVLHQATHVNRSGGSHRAVSGYGRRDESRAEADPGLGAASIRRPRVAMQLAHAGPQDRPTRLGTAAS